MPGLAVFILFLPLGHTLRKQFLTAKLLRTLCLFNLHLIVVPFLGSLIVCGLHLSEIFQPYLKKFLLQGFLPAVKRISRSVEVHLGLSFLRLLHTSGFPDFQGGVLFEPVGFIIRFLLQKLLIILVLGEIEPLIHRLAVGVIFQLNLVLAEKEVGPGLQPG